MHGSRKIQSPLLILFMAVFVSCLKEDFSYHGKPFVDFPSAYQSIVIKGNVTEDYVVNLYVRLCGPQQANPLHVHVHTDPSGTAVSGVHYLLENTVVEIPPHSSYGPVPVKFLIPSFPEQTSVVLVLTLTAGDVEVNPNYNRLVLYVYRQGFIDLFTGRYRCEEPDVPVPVTYDVVLEADTVVKNRLRISNFWGYVADTCRVYLDLLSQVDSVYLPLQGFTDKAGRRYNVQGKGRYAIDDGSIRLTYSLVQQDSSYTEQGEQIYTRR